MNLISELDQKLSADIEKFAFSKAERVLLVSALKLLNLELNEHFKEQRREANEGAGGKSRAYLSESYDSAETGD
jgi:hypothetical protein